jgi:hypothetical protein
MVGIHKWEPDIYIGFSQAPHLQWRHLLRDRRCGTIVCPACWVMGKNQEKYVMFGEKKNLFFTGPAREAVAGQKSLVPAQQAQRTNQGRIPFICTPGVPYLPQFQQSAGST